MKFDLFPYTALYLQTISGEVNLPQKYLVCLFLVGDKPVNYNTFFKKWTINGDKGSYTVATERETNKRLKM